MHSTSSGVLLLFVVLFKEASVYVGNGAEVFCVGVNGVPEEDASCAYETAELIDGKWPFVPFCVL